MFFPSRPLQERRFEELRSKYRAEIREFETWFQGCTHLLLDLGGNRGDSILRWLTEKSYSGRAKDQSVDKFYSLQARQEFCVLSFEPNSKFASVLHTVESSLQERGFKVKVKTNTAVSDKFSRSMIYIDDASTHSYGTSLLPEKKVNFGGKFHKLGKGQPVNLVDLTLIMSSIPKNVESVVKMDIEGGEYDVLRSLVPSGLACSINLLLIEYHSHKLAKGTVPTGINEVMNWILEGNNCGVKIIHDD